MDLQAVVIGAGWAGEGHTKALQACGVDVVAICARQQEVVQQVAARLNVPQASTDWRQTLADAQPDIVTLATPAALRLEVVEQAVRQGCHLLSEKPLATTAAEAERLYALVSQAEVKHAYAATQRYDPGVAWISELLAQQTIGALRGIDVISVLPMFKAFTPYGWVDSLASGGGVLNNLFPHLFGMLETMLNGKLLTAVGGTQHARTHAPVMPELHDFRKQFNVTLTPEEAAHGEWRSCDLDTAAWALCQFKSALSASSPPIQVFIRFDVTAPTPAPNNGWYFYGDQGMLIGQGMFALTVSHLHNGQVEALPVPQRLITELPQGGDDVQQKWTALMREFVADIRNEPHAPYLTFYDGWRYQVAIDAIRRGN
ncbi:oxidoreductase-like protein [Candidatus Moduliflexus flocculans]|uniref:Oxidoreductase-like protein n=1 Tax=Candidatus Moduliflexus flocculans TaxID=1499966 RepID=A0A0S6W146_9BACT|nr:oxidoreductase-like protein [Candidatus Moduliflexus flocculans]